MNRRRRRFRLPSETEGRAIARGLAPLVAVGLAIAFGASQIARGQALTAETAGALALLLGLTVLTASSKESTDDDDGDRPRDDRRSDNRVRDQDQRSEGEQATRRRRVRDDLRVGLGWLRPAAR